VVVDVRNSGELIAGTIPGSLTIPLAQLPHRLAEIHTDRPVVVHCAGGYRSSVAASLLRQQGWTDVSDLLGGYSAWATTVPQPVG
jgi:rhodanese-related sulfurtransferase